MNRSKSKGWKVKNELFRDFLLSYKVDKVRIQKVNMNWSKVSQNSRWEERLIRQQKDRHYSTLACNTRDIGISIFYPG